MKKIYIIVTILICGISIFLYNYLYDEEEVIAEEIIEKVVEPTIEYVNVDIKGAIKNPGVYKLKSDARVSDVIEAAGGLNKNANTMYVNLSKKVIDEMVIWIYTNKEIEELKLGKTIIQYVEKECNCPSVDLNACIIEDSKKININKATKEELMTLDGIGESKALAIIEYRNKNLFKTIDDIKNVSGIGDSAFEKIKDNITV